MFPLALWPVLTILTLLHRASAQSALPVCGDSRFANPNATGSVPIQPLLGFSSPDSGSTSNWTLSTAVRQGFVQESSYNSTSMEQTFWLNSDPVVEPTAAANTSSGCVFALYNLNPDHPPRVTNTDGTCNGVFSSDCQKNIVEFVNSQFQQFTGDLRAPINDSNNVCTLISRSLVMDTPCPSRLWNGAFQNQPFGTTPPNITYNYTACNSSNLNVFDGSATGVTVVGVESPSVPVGNYSSYDIFVDKPWPIIITTFAWNASRGSTPNTQLVCVAADTIVNGSRDPSAHNSAARASVFSTSAGILMTAFWTMVAWTVL